MKRMGETQVGVLIIFSITIIISVGFLGLLGFFYKKYLYNKKYIYVLGNTKSRLEDFKELGICTESSGLNIKYNPMNDRYYLTCSSILGKDFRDFKDISLTLYSGCLKDDKSCEYKLKK